MNTLWLVLPYLQIKRRQAEILLMLAETTLKHGKIIPDEVVAERQALCDEMKELNRRGLVPV